MLFVLLTVLLVTTVGSTSSFNHVKVTENNYFNDNGNSKSTLSDWCQTCQTAVNYILSVLVEYFQVHKIDNYIETFCKIAGSSNISCSALLAEYVTNTVDLINSTNPMTPCRAEHLSSPPSDDLKCEVCEGLVNIGKLYLLSPKVTRILDNFTWKFCRLPGIVTKRCIPWAQDILNRSFYNVLKTDSALVCEYAFLC
ncbi:unnamed protein product [Trichobilharzia szidati]|nr:unnamed protein product [Trichobilharzia szidati]